MERLRFIVTRRAICLAIAVIVLALATGAVAFGATQVRAPARHAVSTSGDNAFMGSEASFDLQWTLVATNAQ